MSARTRETGRPTLARRAALAGVVSCTLALAGCGGSSGAASGTSGGSKQDVSIAFANASADGATYKGLQDTLTAALKGVPGVKLSTYNNDGSATTLFQNVSTMIAEKPDVIIEVNPIADAGTRLSDQLKRSKIPCIAVNVPIAGCAFFNQDIPPLGKQLAQEVAPLMASRGWDGSNTTVILLESAAFGSLNDALWQFIDPLSRKVPGMTPVDASKVTTTSTELGTGSLQVNTDYSTDAAYRKMATTLQALPPGRHMVVDCIGDETCIGAYRAIQNAGRLDDAMLTAWGTTPPAIKLLMTDKAWVTESANFFSSWGEFVAPMALAMAKGVKVPDQTYPPQTILTKKNVAQFFNLDGTVKQFPVLPEASKYLLDQGGILQKAGNVQGVS